MESSDVVQSAFERGTTSLNVRDRIVKERLPIFMKHGDKIFGMGYGGAQYHQFMYDHDAPRSAGRYKDGRYFFNRDEPYVIQLFLHFGFFGLILAVLLLGYMTYDLLRINRHVNLCGVSVLAGLVGVFGIRGLFEGRYLSSLLFIVILYLIQRSLENDSDRGSNEIVSSS
jgi:O-antigen ligase